MKARGVKELNKHLSGGKLSLKRVVIKKCSIEGCQTKYHSLGYCQKHYLRFRTHGDPNIIKTKPRGICSIIGCGLPHAAKGFCKKHYMKFKNTSEGGRPCKFPGCKRTHSAKGYCRKHYAILFRKGKVKYEYIKKKCLVPSCYASTTSKNGYCKFHNLRLRAGIPLTIPKGEAFRGTRNPRWNGGTAEYPNHSQMKRIRKEVLREANNICHFCGAFAYQIHHKDLSKNNHAKENLVACCSKCNQLPEHRKINTFKYKRPSYRRHHESQRS